MTVTVSVGSEVTEPMNGPDTSLAVTGIVVVDVTVKDLASNFATGGSFTSTIVRDIVAEADVSDPSCRLERERVGAVPVDQWLVGPGAVGC